MTHSDLSPIVRHYEVANERDRLSQDVGLLERARSVELLQQFLPPPPAIVLDVGGGTGEYAAWLGSEGYETHLIDLVPRHVEEARARSDREGGTITSCEVGDARSLSRSDESTDVVLLMGPLYHLTEPADRRSCLSEALRVLRPGGTLVAAAISRYASLLDGLRMARLGDGTLREMIERDLDTGLHLNPTGETELFTSARLHTPEELRAELSAAGFAVRGLRGVEGPGWLLADFAERWSESDGREQILWAARQAESEPHLIGVSAHLIAIGSKSV